MPASDRTTASWQLDCRDMPAPYPLLGARAALSMMGEGEVLGLLVTDRDSIADVPAWCRMTGHRLIVAEERCGVACVLIRKGSFWPSEHGPQGRAHGAKLLVEGD